MHTTVGELESGLITPPAAAAGAVRWRLATRLAFRFWAVYLTLYILTTQMFFSLFVLPAGRIPSPGQNQTFRDLVSWVATDVFGFSRPLTLFSGSGDKPYDWAHAFVLLTAAALVTLVWSVAARRRLHHAALQKWFRLFLRFSLGASLVTYGMVKAFPLQMPYPNLTRLLEPYGHFSLMGVLWAQVGASPAFERFTGIVELVAGVLLFIPGLTMLGAVASLAATGFIFVLNMTYDVPVKLFSLHLVVMSLMLLAPDARRLLHLLVLNRAVPPSSEPSLVSGRRARWIAVAAQLLLAAWLVGFSFTVNSQSYKARGPAAPKPPLYGIWTIETMAIDGQIRSALVTDYDRWRRLIIQNATSLSFQRMDDTFVGFGATVDMAAKTIALTASLPGPANPSPAPAGRLTFEQPRADRLVLDGQVNGRKLRMELQHFDRSSLRLLQSRFRWVQDLPFNR